MKILQLVKKFPSPPKDGESIAVMSSSKGYVELGCKISLLSMNTKKHFVENTDGEDLSHYDKVETTYLNNDINPLSAFLNLFSKDSYNINRFDCHLFRKKLSEILKNSVFDVVQLESLYMLPYIDTIRKDSNALIVFRSHNLEHEIWNNLSITNKNPLLKWYFKLCSNRLHNYELSKFEAYDLLMPISMTDHQKYLNLGYKNEIVLSPVGINMDDYQVNKSVINNSIKLGYIGSLDWKPNIEGLNWFFNNIWNSVSKKFSNIEFHLAGRNPNKNLKNLMVTNLVNHGEVESAKSFLENLDIIVVPLLSGSGIRIKILESMAMGKVVLSTKKGFEGINIESGKHGFIFKDSLDFESQIKLLIENAQLVIEVSNNAKQFIIDNFDYKNLAQKNINKFNQIKAINE